MPPSPDAPSPDPSPCRWLLAALAALALPAGANQINTGGGGRALSKHFCPRARPTTQARAVRYRCTPRPARARTSSACSPIRASWATPSSTPSRWRPAAEGRGRAHHRAPGRRARVPVRGDAQYGARPTGAKWRPTPAAVALHPAAGRLGQRRQLPIPARASMRTASARPRASPTRHRPRTRSARRCSAEDTVSLFVQFADPDSERFVLVASWAATSCRSSTAPSCARRSPARRSILPRRRRSRMRSGSSGPQDRDGLHAGGACSRELPTGSQGEQARKDHEDLIRTIAALKSGSLLPEERLFQKLLKRTKELSAASTEKVLEATEQAREKARPYTDKAHGGGQGGEPSRPTGGRAGFRGGQALLRQDARRPPRRPTTMP